MFGTRGYKALLEHSFEYCMKVEAIVVSHRRGGEKILESAKDKGSQLIDKC